jgi:NADP-reducing hydrogenase subunit HndC
MDNISIRKIAMVLFVALLSGVTLNLLSCSDSVEKVRVTGTDVNAKSTVVIDGEICYGCVLESCKTLCPQKAVSKSQIGNRSVFIIDPQKCIKCGICIEKCPFDAITWKH